MIKVNSGASKLVEKSDANVNYMKQLQEMS